MGRQTTAVLVLAVGLVALALLVTGVVVGRRSRDPLGRGRIGTSAGLVGLGLAGAFLVACSFWEFGGHGDTGDYGNPRLCGQWWEQIADHGRGVGIASGSYCYDHAVHAVLPVLGVAALVACVTGGLQAVRLVMRDRRPARFAHRTP